MKGRRHGTAHSSKKKPVPIELHPVASATMEKMVAAREEFIAQAGEHLERLSAKRALFTSAMEAFNKKPRCSKAQIVIDHPPPQFTDEGMSDEEKQAFRDGKLQEFHLYIPSSEEMVNHLEELRQEGVRMGKILDQIHDSIALSLPALQGGGAALIAKTTLMPYIRVLSSVAQRCKGLLDDYLRSCVSVEKAMIRCPQSPTAQEMYYVVQQRHWNQAAAYWLDLEAAVAGTYFYLIKNKKAIEDSTLGKHHKTMVL